MRFLATVCKLLIIGAGLLTTLVGAGNPVKGVPTSLPDAISRIGTCNSVKGEIDSQPRDIGRSSFTYDPSTQSLMIGSSVTIGLDETAWTCQGAPQSYFCNFGILVGGHIQVKFSGISFQNVISVSVDQEAANDPITIDASDCSGAKFSAPPGSCPDPEVVQNLDVTQYANNQSWYEVARTKSEIFETGLVCVNAKYFPKPDGHLAVVNQGRLTTPEGKMFSIVGDAYPKDPTVPAKLSVKFPNAPWEAPYWILWVDEGYQHAIVYSCQDLIEFGWILSRTPLVDNDTLEELFLKAEEHGITRSFLTPVLQVGCY